MERSDFKSPTTKWQQQTIFQQKNYSGACQNRKADFIQGNSGISIGPLQCDFVVEKDIGLIFKDIRKEWEFIAKEQSVCEEWGVDRKSLRENLRDQRDSS